MTTDPNLELLRKTGDPLEILICRVDEPLLSVLLPYARVWANHIEPRRIGDGSQIEPEWMTFGGCHYTSLIRLYHAFRAKEQTLAVCKSAETLKDKIELEDYSLLLDVHASCAAFWENLGASIDNLFAAREEVKKLFGIKIEKRKENQNQKEKFNARTVSSLRNPKLHYAYDRRTQFIHSLLVPKIFKKGQVVFNVRHYDDETTSWVKVLEPVDKIDSRIETDWDESLKELATTWEQLYALLQEHDKRRPKEELKVSLTTFSPSALSASVSVPPSGTRSNISVPPPSGFFDY